MLEASLRRQGREAAGPAMGVMLVVAQWRRVYVRPVHQRTHIRSIQLPAGSSIYSNVNIRSYLLHNAEARPLCAGIPRHTCDPQGSKRPPQALGYGRCLAAGNRHPRLLAYLTDGYRAGPSDGGIAGFFFLCPPAP